MEYVVYSVMSHDNEYDIGRVFFDNVELDVSVKMLVKTIDL